MGGDSLERILGSRARIRILRYIIKAGEANITRISRETGIHHAVVSGYLKELSRMGLVEESRMGRVKIYRPVWSNAKIRILAALMED